MESRLAFWKKKSASTPTSPDTDTRRKIPIVKEDEWKGLPSRAKAILISLNQDGYFEESTPSANLTLSSFNWKSLAEVYSVPSQLWATKVTIPIENQQVYCYLYKKIGTSLFKFIKLEDFAQYFHDWNYVGDQVFEKKTSDEDDAEISFRRPADPHFQNREDFEDDLNETVRPQNENGDPLALELNSHSSGDQIPSAQPQSTIVDTPVGPVCIDIQANRAYYHDKHTMEASEQQELATIRDQSRTPTLVQSRTLDTVQTINQTTHPDRVSPVSNQLRDPYLAYMARFPWAPGQYEQFVHYYNNRPSNVDHLFYENNEVRQMFRPPQRVNRRTESDYSDVSDSDTDQQQLPASRTSQHSPTKRRRALQGKFLSTFGNQVSNQIQQPETPVNRQIDYQSTPITTQDAFIRGVSTSQPQTVVANAHPTSQTSQMIRPQAIQHSSQRARPVVQVSQFSKRALSQNNNNVPVQQSSNTYNLTHQATRSTQVSQAPFLAHRVQPSQQHTQINTNYLPRAVPTSGAYNTQAPPAAASSLPTSQMSTNVYATNMHTISRPSSQPSLHRPSPLYQQHPPVSSHNMYPQPSTAYNIPMVNNQPQQVNQLPQQYHIQAPQPQLQQQAPVNNIFPPFPGPRSQGEATSAESLTRDNQLKAILSRLPPDFIKFAGTGVSIDDWLSRVAQYVDPIENEDTRKYALLALIKPSPNIGSLTTDGWSGSYAELINYLKLAFQNTITETNLSEWSSVSRTRNQKITDWVKTHTRLLSFTVTGWNGYTPTELQFILAGLKKLAPPSALTKYVQGKTYFLGAFKAEGIFGVFHNLNSHQEIHEVEWKHFDDNRLKPQAARTLTIQATPDPSFTPSTSGTSGRFNRHKHHRRNRPENQTANPSAPQEQRPEPPPQRQPRQLKYCSYHKKEGFHTTAQCKALKALNEAPAQPSSQQQQYTQQNQNYNNTTRQEQTGRPPAHQQGNNRPANFQGNQRQQQQRNNSFNQQDNRQGPARPNQSQFPNNRRNQGYGRSGNSGYNPGSQQNRRVNNIEDQQPQQQHQNQQPAQRNQQQQGNWAIPGHDSVGLGIINTR